ncbi:unnamed protein product [Cylicocyclus nassatus]|uniref:Uncharacterized protein n=1 Tax=Cylicocyclus nassatus TaxID=53992 RepID=A0AA36DNB1_CYLNA|nr:unnamed protein product [Cylicocyclus nassatus]
MPEKSPPAFENINKTMGKLCASSTTILVRQKQRAVLCHFSPEKLAAFTCSVNDVLGKGNKTEVLNNFYLVWGDKLLELFQLSRSGAPVQMESARKLRIGAGNILQQPQFKTWDQELEKTK